VPAGRIQVRNAAAVMVTAKLSPYLKKGAATDVTVSSMGDAKSLEGGTLLLSPLQGPDGEVYAQAQGALSVGGMQHEGTLGRASLIKNHALVGDIPNGALVQKEPVHSGFDTNEVRISLQTPDFSSAVSLAKAVNTKFGNDAAQASDPATVKIAVPKDWRGRFMEFVSGVENLDFAPSRVARVVLNEKTGTVIAGGEVTISEVAVAHGNITVEIKQNQQTQIQTGAAPGAVTQQSATNISEDIQAKEDKADVRLMPASSNVTDLAKSLNALGVTPRDIIAIFEAIKQAGALNAELVVM
jgi:flagellar P-ring protein precursor FlgI